MYPRHCENYVMRLHILFKFSLVNILWRDTGWKWVLPGWGESPGSLFNLFWRGVLPVFALYNAFTEGRASIRRLWTLYHWIMVKIPVSQLVSFHTSFLGKERGTLLPLGGRKSSAFILGLLWCHLGRAQEQDLQGFRLVCLLHITK